LWGLGGRFGGLRSRMRVILQLKTYICDEMVVLMLASLSD
jgi:hypothetical protein